MSYNTNSNIHTSVSIVITVMFNTQKILLRKKNIGYFVSFGVEDSEYEHSATKTVHRESENRAN